MKLVLATALDACAKDTAPHGKLKGNLSDWVGFAMSELAWIGLLFLAAVALTFAMGWRKP